MPLSPWRSTFCLFAPIVLLGCSSPTPPAPPMAPPTAEERFDTIVQTLKRRIENEPMVGGAGLDSPPGPSSPRLPRTDPARRRRGAVPRGSRPPAA